MFICVKIQTYKYEKGRRKKRMNIFKEIAEGNFKLEKINKDQYTLTLPNQDKINIKTYNYEPYRVDWYFYYKGRQYHSCFAGQNNEDFVNHLIEWARRRYYTKEEPKEYSNPYNRIDKLLEFEKIVDEKSKRIAKLYKEAAMTMASKWLEKEEKRLKEVINKEKDKTETIPTPETPRESPERTWDMGVDEIKVDVTPKHDILAHYNKIKNGR
jgi:hypothetical protein